MAKKRHNIAIQTRGCFGHINTLYPAVIHAPNKESKVSVVVLTDSRNQKIEHQTIRWEDLTFPKHWVVSNPKPLALKQITSVDIREEPSSAILSFPRRSTIDSQIIDQMCRSSPLYRNPEFVDIACSSSSSNSCKHISLFEFAQLVNFSSLK